jgi:hypothetical protein
LATPIQFRAPSVLSGTIVNPNVLATPISFRTMVITTSGLTSPGPFATPIVFHAPTILGGAPIVHHGRISVSVGVKHAARVNVAQSGTINLEVN